MRDILARSGREMLATFAGSKLLLALDFDGTLAPIVADPESAGLRVRTRHLLRQLAHHCPCVVISGRARADVLRRLQGTGIAEVIGNHGLEPSPYAAAARRAVRRWLPDLRGRLDGLPGVIIEDKGVSIALHYRHAPRRELARAQLLDAAARLGGVRLIGGKLVLNVLPAGAPHKGQALEAARGRFGCDTALYVGDDETDEDAFALDEAGWLLGIRVGRSRNSAARYCIRAQGDIDRLLQLLLTALKATTKDTGRVSA